MVLRDLANSEAAIVVSAREVPELPNIVDRVMWCT
jgi:ABC-type sugar transport system ATPase subunit